MGANVAVHRRIVRKLVFEIGGLYFPLVTLSHHQHLASTAVISIPLPFAVSGAKGETIAWASSSVRVLPCCQPQVGHLVSASCFQFPTRAYPCHEAVDPYA